MNESNQIFPFYGFNRGKDLEVDRTKKMKMRCQARLNSENETRFRSGGKRDVEQLFYRIYPLVYSFVLSAYFSAYFYMQKSCKIKNWQYINGHIRQLCKFHGKDKLQNWVKIYVIVG